jgi:hypothetical protein
MPITVKAFSVLCVVLIATWVYSLAGNIAFPSAHYVSMLAKLPPEMRGEARHFDSMSMGISTVAWCVMVLLLGWLAAFRRQNWARWVLLAVFVLAVLVPFVGMGVFNLEHSDIARISPYRQFAWHELASYARPNSVLVLGIKILMLLLVFSPNARPWFIRANT